MGCMNTPSTSTGNHETSDHAALLFPVYRLFRVDSSGRCLCVTHDRSVYPQRVGEQKSCKCKDSWGYITVPVLHQPRGTKIRDIKIDNSTAWKKRILKTLRCTYKRAEEHPLYQCLKSQEEEMLSPILCNTLKFTAHYLGLSTEFVESSPSHERSQELILSVCKDFGATTYINLPGGMGLYDETQFAKNAVELKFMKPTSHPNTLSILDLCLGDGYHAMD